ncbi:MAG TPA: hypothetical protein VHD15_15785, partial [Hyphomicrobiales bacterium]|nr:hypothetical protein [Hyphomicrobiales bacterium]
MSDTPGTPDDRDGDGPGRGLDAAMVEALAAVLGTAFADLAVEIDRRIARAVAAIGEAAQPAAALPPLDAAAPGPPPKSAAPAVSPAVPPPAGPLPPLTTAPLADYDFTAGWAWWQPASGVEAPHPGVVASSDGTAGADLAG